MEIKNRDSVTDAASHPAHSLPAHIEAWPAVGARLTPAPTQSAAPDAIGLLKAFRRRWRLALGLGALGAALASCLAWYLVPPAEYLAESWLYVEPEQPKLIVATKENHPDPEIDRQTQVRLIRSPVVLNKALAQPEVVRLAAVRRHVEPSEWLGRVIEVGFTGKILRLALSGDDPVEVTTLVKAVTNAYLSEVANKEKARRVERKEVLERHYVRLQAQLESKRNNMKSLATSLGSRDRQTLSWQQRMAISRQGMAEQELLRTQLELKRAMAELKVLERRVEKRGAEHEVSGSGAVTADSEAERAIQNDAYIQGCLQQEQRLKDMIYEAGRVARDAASEPSIQAARAQLARVRKGRQAYEKRRRSELLARGTKPAEARDPAESSLVELQDQISVLNELERELKGDVGQVTQGTRQIGAQALEMESIQDEIKHADDMARLIGGELEALKIELSAPDRVRLIEEAKVPQKKDKSRRIRVAGMGAGGAFAAIVLLISFWEFRAGRIESQDDVTHGLGIRVVGTVPAIPGSARGALSKTSGSRRLPWEQQLIESVDTARIMMFQAAHAESYRLVLVTSAVGGEGKTSLSSMLATSLARSGRRTLLIDGDFRRPMVHHLFDQPSGPGFCDLIRDESGIDDVIRPTGVTNLWILPVGNHDEHTMLLLSQPRTRALFDRLREQFEFVVVDSAPVLPVADTLLLSLHVDAALFSVRRGVSQFPKINAAYERITALGIPILGAVVCGTQSGTYYSDSYDYIK